MTASVQVRASAYYPFNGNALDESTSGLDATVNSTYASLTTDRFGNANSAYLLDATDVQNKIYIPASTALFESGDLTFSTWVKPTNLLNYQFMFDHYNWRFYISSTYGIYWCVGRMNSGSGDTFYVYSSVGGVTLVNDTWYNIVGTYHPDLVGEGSAYEDAIAFYPFSGNALDAVGSNDGVVTGASLTTGHYGTAQSAYSFDDSSSQYITITDTNILNTKSVFTISFYRKRTTYKAWRNCFSTGNNKDRFEDGNNSGNLVFYGTSLIANGSSLISTGLGNSVWEHIVISADGSNVKTYLNGTLKSTTVQTGAWDGDGSIYLGTRYAGGSVWNGVIDDVAIWDRALSATEVEDLYNFVHGGEIKLYVDGTLMGTTPIYNDVINIGYGSSDVQWGNSNHGAAVPFEGVVDETILLPVALTATEVAALYELTARHDWNDVFVTGKFSKAAEMLMVGKTGTSTEPNYGPSIDLGALIYLPYNSCSISWWQKILTSAYDMSTPHMTRVFSAGENGTSGRIDFYLATNTLRWESLTNNVWEPHFDTGINVDDGNWHHYVLTSGTSDSKLYVDGILADTGIACTDTIDQRFRYIGSYYTGAIFYGSGLQGSICEVMFFEKELSSSDVIILYTASGKVTE